MLADITLARYSGLHAPRWGGRRASGDAAFLQARRLLSQTKTKLVIPAKAGIQSGLLCVRCPWIPAFAGMTRVGELCPHNPRLPNRAYHPTTSST